MLQSVAVCCSVLQCVAVCCSVLQCVAVCCSVLQCVAVWPSVAIRYVCERHTAFVCVSVCCSVLQCTAVSCSVLQYASGTLHSCVYAVYAYMYEGVCVHVHGHIISVCVCG